MPRALRAVVVQGGATSAGRRPTCASAADGPLRQRLLAAPLFAQARFDGPAQALWALGGVEALDVRGPVALALDAGGHLGDPRLTGTIAAHGARVENLTLGTVVDNVTLDGRFTGVAPRPRQFHRARSARTARSAGRARSTCRPSAASRSTSRPSSTTRRRSTATTCARR